MEKGATISACGKFRYSLWRRWAEGPLMVFVMLNPSTADSEQDDPTIRKCIGFSKRHGYAGILVVNLFAYRATNPRDLYRAGPLLASAIGPANDANIQQAARMSFRDGSPVVLAWGAHARGLNRAQDVLTLLRCEYAGLFTLALTADGVPRHPLMLSYSCTLTPYLT